MKRFCARCGNPGDASTAFCENCGASMKGTDSAEDARVPELPPEAGSNIGSLREALSIKNLIVASMEVITGLAVLVITTTVALVGYLVGRFYFHGWGVSGAFIGLGIGLLLATQVTGLIYVLLSINDRLGEIKKLLQSRRA